MSNCLWRGRIAKRLVSFNPSVGILFCRTKSPIIQFWPRLVFQSLGRDSVLSNLLFLAADVGLFLVSIPRSGFCFVERDTVPLILPRLVVSIPRSGFCFVERDTVPPLLPRLEVSIPRSGFCFVEPRLLLAPRPAVKPFQSLGRDSVLSNWEQISRRWFDKTVSIPRSGFCFVEHGEGRLVAQSQTRFNPSVGILFCRTTWTDWGFGRELDMFQSLGRDSVLSNHARRDCMGTALRRFNPSVGILFCRTDAGRPWGRCFARFNPSVGILFCRTTNDRLRHLEATGFNPSVGILFCRTDRCR